MKSSYLLQSAKAAALELHPVQDELCLTGPRHPRAVDVPEQADLVVDAGAHVYLGAVEVPDGDVKLSKSAKLNKLIPTAPTTLAG